MAQKAPAPEQVPPAAEGTEQPAPDAKKKKEKKPKLSKAEKKRLKLLAAMELKKKLIRDQLQRELLLTDKSIKRGKIQWDDMCKHIAEKELREEIQTWSKKAEVLIEKKDEKIHQLVNTIEETHELSERAFCGHMEQLNYLTNCHKVLRQTATEIFEMQATDMITDFFMEMELIQGSHEDAKRNYEYIVHTSNILAKERLQQNYELYMREQFSEVCKEIEKRYIIRDATVIKMKQLQDTLLLWMKALQGDLLDVHKSKKFMYFMQRQVSYVKESKKLNEIERSTTKTMMDLEQELLSIETETNKKIYGLKLQQAYFVSVRNIIKSAIDRDKAATYEKLREVASKSYELTKELQEFVKRGEFLLGLATCCRKYETENEKVNTWKINPVDCVIDPEFLLKLKVDIRKYLDISEDDLIEQMTFLKNFWFRCSRVRLHNLLLMEEKRKLEEENENYRNIIRSMKKSDDVAYILEALEIKQIVLYFHLFYVGHNFDCQLIRLDIRMM